MNIAVIQQSIVDKLADGFTNANAMFLSRNMPESGAQYELGLTKPIAYVHYNGSQSLPSISTNIVAQPRKMKFSVECHSRLLYDVPGSLGLHTVRNLVEQVLLGFKPTNCQRLYLLQDDAAKTEDGIWVHVYQFECETMLIQVDAPDSIVVPNFEGLTTSE